LLPSRKEASQFPTGEISLAFCTECGFITNTTFDPHVAEYSERYEETQAFSERFVTFARSLARHWVERYDLRGKSVLEIGCGKGEFLVMLAEAGIGRGIGIDPGLDPQRIQTIHADKLEWIPGFFPEDYDVGDFDAIVCRHTLEHISPVGDFMREVRATIDGRPDKVVLFELPDVRRVLEEVAFWDIYYEHCSYFGVGSLARLFERSGFEVLDVAYAFEDQYVILEARPLPVGATPTPWPADDIQELFDAVREFERRYEEATAGWSRRLAALRQDGRTAVVWGAGSKAVSFLAHTGANVEVAVDINPHKHGMYIAGTGHRIVAPGDLVAIDPDLVIAMNPIYLAEIQNELDELGVRADLVSL
jgi:SAM-dependent methyltransferase